MFGLILWHSKTKDNHNVCQMDLVVAKHTYCRHPNPMEDQKIPPHHPKIIKDQPPTVDIINSNISWMLQRKKKVSLQVEYKFCKILCNYETQGSHLLSLLYDYILWKGSRKDLKSPQTVSSSSKNICKNIGTEKSDMLHLADVSFIFYLLSFSH